MEKVLFRRFSNPLFPYESDDTNEIEVLLLPRNSKVCNQNHNTYLQEYSDIPICVHHQESFH